MAHAVGHVLRRVPFLYAKMSVPTGVEHLRSCDLDPRAITLHFQSRLERLAGLQWEKLRSHFHHAALLSIQREGDDLIPGHIHQRGRGRRLAFAFIFAFAGGRRTGAFGPPFAGRERVEFGELRAKGLRCGLGERRDRLEGKRADSGGGQFDSGAAVDGCHDG